MALGPLELSHNDLWHITRGQLFDLIIAYNYKKFLERREHLLYAADAGRLEDGKQHTFDEICGEWLENRVMTLEEANEYYIKQAKKAGEKRGRKKTPI